MMYQKKFAVALKSANGRVLRELDGDKVYIPFGSEYTVFLKNMHNRRAVAQVSIDGIDVGDGMTFVIPTHKGMNIERFVKNGNLEVGNRFKFIERTNNVANHRGVDIEDGLVRVTFQLERIPQPDLYTLRSKSVSDSRGFSPTFSSSSAPIASSDMDRLETFTSNEVGVTAPGSISEQQFSMSDNFPLESEKIVFVIQILGETENNSYVREPITVKTKPQCGQCGALNRYDAKFCHECGAGLQIV